jgi:hypothetical protein
MPEPNEVRPEPQSDDDWKDRVKSDDAAIDASSQTQPDEPELPQATFASLIHLLTAQAMSGLGLVAGPDGKPHRQLSVARHFIDLLAVIETKTKGQLDSTEASMLEDVLHDLRMAFIAVSKNP